MTMLTQAAASVLARGAALQPAAWDLKTFLTNAKTYITDAGGLLLMLVGTAALIWGGVRLVQKLMAGQQGGAQISWATILLLILAGGALMTGGISLMTTIGGGGETTIRDLGGGAALLPLLGI